MVKNLNKIYLTYYNLLTVQYLWQAHCQILLIILLKEFIELNANTDMMIKNQEICGIKYNYCDCFLEYITFKDDLKEYRCYVVTKITNTSLTKC